MGTNQLTLEVLLQKADTAYFSAVTLLNANCPDDAANRAYYAMFDAARAALLATHAPVRENIGKTHNGLIKAFGQYISNNNLVPRYMIKILTQAHRIRQIADYTGDFVEFTKAQKMVENAGEFIKIIKEAFNIDAPPDIRQNVKRQKPN